MPAPSPSAGPPDPDAVGGPGLLISSFACLSWYDPATGACKIEDGRGRRSGRFFYIATVSVSLSRLRAWLVLKFFCKTLSSRAFLHSGSTGWGGQTSPKATIRGAQARTRDRHLL